MVIRGQFKLPFKLPLLHTKKVLRTYSSRYLSSVGQRAHFDAEMDPKLNITIIFYLFDAIMHECNVIGMCHMMLVPPCYLSTRDD